METNSFFGYKCPKCNTTIDIGVIVGNSKPLCPNCKTEMIPDNNGKVSAANVHCKKCNSFYGLINSDRCPQCGELFSKS